MISDLHLGSRLQHDVLRHTEALEALLAELESVDRLVLLGDVVELLEGRPERAMEVAEPVLRAVGARLGDGGEVIVVPGNHDGELVRPWLRAQGMQPDVDPHPVRRDALARPSHAHGSDPLMSASVIRASGWGSVCGQPMATISIVTCCRKQPLESPAGCWGACRGMAPRRPTTSGQEAHP